MTREDIIRMALRAELERFAALIASRVAAASASVEREIRTDALALLDTIHMGNESKRSQDIIRAAVRTLQRNAPEELAAALRARGETSSRGQREH